jgi:hypothetical protein
MFLCYNEGMENQQQQPVMPQTNDFLSRMDQVTNPTPVVEPEKKGLSKGAIIGIIVGAVALIGIIVGIVIAVNSGKKEPAPTITNTATPEPEPEIDEEMEARNKLRASDLVVVSDAIKTYQSSAAANGQLPGPYTDEWRDFLRIYIPQGVYDGADDLPYTIGAVCKFGEPCIDISSLTWENDGHKIFALYNADCKGKTKENVIVSSTRKRRVAIFAIIEGDQFICATN